MQGIFNTIETIITSMQAVLSGFILLPVLFGVGVFLTVGLKFAPIRRIPRAFVLLFKGTHPDKEDIKEGEITPFGALMTALSATVGTGNIGGVALALYLGGPGALFWMWMTALVGIASKYAEAVLAVKYREIDAEGNHIGGPMYYIKNGMGKNWMWMASTFAVFGIFSSYATGNSIQALSVSSVFYESYGISPILSATVMALLVAAVLLGGIKRIAAVASTVVPTMAVLYVFFALTIILLNAPQIPGAFATIFKSAFSYDAAEGGFFGSAFWLAIRYGVARGIFSNEAGQGSAPIAHAAAQTHEPVKQGQVAMLGTFIDTLIICTLTGLVVIITGAVDWTSEATAGAPTTVEAFARGLPFGKDSTGQAFGAWIVIYSLAFFAFTTVLGWSYYGERCSVFLFGEKSVTTYRISYCIVTFLGGASVALGSGGFKNIIEIVWLIGDVAIALMAVPNLVALAVLFPVIKRLSDEAFARSNH